MAGLFIRIISSFEFLITGIFNMVYNPAYNKILQTKETLPHGMCYSHFGNGVRNGAISIMQCQWGKILVMAMGFVDHLGQYFLLISEYNTNNFSVKLNLISHP